ncbi:MAG: hypothetical protein ACPG4K_15100, partial [Haloferula sp.]
MTFPRKIGLIMIITAALAALGEIMGWSLPSLRWFFSFDADPNSVGSGAWQKHQGAIIGYGFCTLIAVAGSIAMATGGSFHWNPLTLRKWQRFQSIGRGYGSFRLLIFFMVLALLDQVLVGKKALAVRHQGEWFFPAFVDARYTGEDFGRTDDGEVDYRVLKKESAGSDTLVILPPVPWDPTFDSDEFMERTLPVIDGVIHVADGRETYDGFAYCYQLENPEKLLRKVRVRAGQPKGSAEVMGDDGEAIGREIW